MALPKDGELRVANFKVKCVACGAYYHPKFYYVGPQDNAGKMKCISSSDHVCSPRTLRRRERQLEHEFDDESPYCECDDLDCKFEFLDQMRNEME